MRLAGGGSLAAARWWQPPPNNGIKKMDYIAEYSRKADQLLLWLEKETNLRSNYARMLCGAEEGTLLEFISKMISPKHILEIGTFTGYSAICLARGLRDGGRLDALEINDELADLILTAFERANLSHCTNLILGDALEIIPTLDCTYDLVFMDANKRDYIKYYNAFIDKVRSGGFIIADNVLWSGKVLSGNPTEMPHDPQTMGIHAFNQMISQDPRVENVIIPLRDGINLIRKK